MATQWQFTSDGKPVMTAGGQPVFAEAGTPCCCSTPIPCLCSKCTNATCPTGSIRVSFAGVTLIATCIECVMPFINYPTYGPGWCGQGFPEITGGVTISYRQQLNLEWAPTITGFTIDATGGSDASGFGHSGPCPWIGTLTTNTEYGPTDSPIVIRQYTTGLTYDEFGCIDELTSPTYGISTLTHVRAERVTRTVGGVTKDGWAVAMWAESSTTYGGHVYVLLFCGFRVDPDGSEDICIQDGGIEVANMLDGTGPVCLDNTTMTTCVAKLFAGMTSDAVLDFGSCYTAIAGSGGTATITVTP